MLGVGAEDIAQGNDWNYITEPQKGAGGRRLLYSRGKGIGGSSLKNFMIYQRPTESSFDSWQAAAAGTDSPGWAWKDVYKYFTKSAVLTPPNNAKRGAQYTPRYK